MGDFTSYADYAGLNQDAAAEMRQKLEDSYGGPREQQINDLRDQHYRDSRTAGMAGGGFGGTDGIRGRNDAMSGYAKSGAAVGTATTTYGNYMSSLTDTKLRQALLEKAYGSASAIDSSLMGEDGAGAGAVKQTMGDINAANKASSARADQNMAAYGEGRKMTAAYDAQEQARQKAMKDAYQNATAATTERQKNTRIDAYRAWRNGGKTATDADYGNGAGSSKSAFGLGDSRTHEQMVADERNNYSGLIDVEEQRGGKKFRVGSSGEGSWG